jgi:hypothetical protein
MWPKQNKRCIAQLQEQGMHITPAWVYHVCVISFPSMILDIQRFRCDSDLCALEAIEHKSSLNYSGFLSRQL